MPKIVDHRLRKKHLAKAAVSVIGQSGLEGLRLVDVAKAAGATTGMVTHYLGDKNAVIMAALEEVAGDLTSNVDNIIDAGIIEALCNILPVDDISRRNWRVWIAYWGGAIGNADLAERHRQIYNRFRTEMAAHIRRMPANQRPDPAPEMVADLVIAALDGVGTRAALEPDLWPAQRQKDHLRALLEPLLTPATSAALAS